MLNMNEEQISQRYNFTPGITERKLQSSQANVGKKSALKKKSSDKEEI